MIAVKDVNSAWMSNGGRRPNHLVRKRELTCQCRPFGTVRVEELYSHRDVTHGTVQVTVYNQPDHDVAPPEHVRERAGRGWERLGEAARNEPFACACIFLSGMDPLLYVYGTGMVATTPSSARNGTAEYPLALFATTQGNESGMVLWRVSHSGATARVYRFTW